MARKKKHAPGSDPFDVTLPEGYEVEAALEEAARHEGWAIERVGTLVAVRDVWTDNEDHAAWLVATKAGISPERVTVWAGRGE